MAYALQRDETTSAAIVRIMNEQVARARDQLTATKVPGAKRVHDARKRFKETRALLRLVRDPLGAQFAIENARFRDAGGDLASVRDADAMLEALEKLDLPSPLKKHVAKALKKQRSHPPLETLIATTLEQLVLAQARIAFWPPLDDSFDTIAAGLRRTYRDGVRAMRNARNAEQLHEWRKHVKTHWYHLQLLRETWPPILKASADALEELSRTLGDHHDLHVLASTVADPPPELLASIGERQQQLERRAFELGARIYAEKPNAWLERMRKYWSAWRESS
jgi:CHAD domain-containing protein